MAKDQTQDRIWYDDECQGRDTGKDQVVETNTKSQRFNLDEVTPVKHVQ